MSTIIITESQFDFIKNNDSYTENNTLEVFTKEVKNFLYHVLKKDFDSISDYWRINGLNRTEVYKELKRFGVVIESKEGEVSVPKRNFDRKVERVYYSLFKDEEPGLIMTEDEGAAGGESFGGTSCSSVGGSYEQPVFGVQRRKIHKVTNNN